jgi:hypothetical protein
MFSGIEAVELFSLPPQAEGTLAAFSRMGYDLETALADIIDNSIDAKATQVEITLFRDETQILAVTIADDGRGMSAAQLRDGMRFAGRNQHAELDLGTFGLGLKSASFSQCETLTVISRAGGAISACRWNPAAMGNNWQCEVLDAASAARSFANGYSAFAVPADSGTLVIWDRLTRLAVQGNLDLFFHELRARLELALGLIFHRFIAEGRIAILITVREFDEPSGFPSTVQPHDPFGYPGTGRTGYPKTFRTMLPGVGELALDAHIWPAGSLDANFRLGRRSGTGHQGLYFYRNDRLIQAGGWNGFLKDVSDAELSLARVAIELPAAATRDVTVQKSAVQLTAGLSQALEQARSGKISLRDYLEDARRTYRAGRRQPSRATDLPIVPGAGLPAAARRAIVSQICHGDLYREIDFDWVSLAKGTIFAVDDDREQILLNQKYRKRILGTARASAVDAPVIKLLLFLLLEPEFRRERTSFKQTEWLERCNAILFQAIKTL